MVPCHPTSACHGRRGGALAPGCCWCGSQSRCGWEIPWKWKFHEVLNKCLFRFHIVIKHMESNEDLMTEQNMPLGHSAVAIHIAGRCDEDRGEVVGHLLITGERPNLQHAETIVPPQCLASAATLRHWEVELHSYLSARVPHVQDAVDPVPLVASAQHFVYARSAEASTVYALNSRGTIWSLARSIQRNHRQQLATQFIAHAGDLVVAGLTPSEYPCPNEWRQAALVMLGKHAVEAVEAVINDPKVN